MSRKLALLSSCKASISIFDYKVRVKCELLNEKKQRFMDGIVPKWIDEAKKNGKLIEL